jgi:hypothetical protein
MENTITFLVSEQEDHGEMLRIAPDGFYVRGQKIAQDEREAQRVYESFTQWLAWTHLQRNQND